MRRKFSELEDAMDPKQLARAKAEAKEMMAAMVLTELRKHSDLTQEELAEKLGIKQPTLSRLEGQSDMQISTLCRFIEAIGGNLELIAHLPNGDVRIKQFEPEAV